MNRSTVTKVFAAFIALASASPMARAAKPSYSDEIQSKRIFPSPIEWIGRQEAAEADAPELLGSLNAFDSDGPKAGFAASEQFLTSHPKSPWAASLHVNLAERYRSDGRFTGALDHWQKAWDLTKESDSIKGQHLAARAMAGRTRLLASLGRKEDVNAAFKELDERQVPLGSYGTTIQGTKEGLIMMNAHPGNSFRCGSFALGHVAQTLGVATNFVKTLFKTQSPDRGFQVSQLLKLASSNGIPVEAVWRPAGAEIPVPSVVHWKLNHYAAILEKKDGRYRVIDPTFGGEAWMDDETINAETSGVFLLPVSQKPANWRKLTEVESATFYGKGYPNFFPDWDDDGPDNCDPPDDQDADCDPPAANDGPSSNGDTNQPPCGCGMPQWSVSQPYETLWLTDTPLFYHLSNGKWMKVQLRYKSRGEDKGSSVSGFGKKWECNLLGMVQADSSSPSYVTNHLAGGGMRAMLKDGTLTYKGGLSFSTIGSTAIAVSTPMLSKAIYATRAVFSAGHTNYFLSQRLDRYGRSTTFNYNTNSSRVVLTNVVDVDGRSITLAYTNASFPNLITSVTDPYNRIARFFYDNQGRLTNILDAAAMSSSFKYDTSDNITNMTTLYGQTSFQYLSGISTNYDNSLRRGLLVTEASGDQQLYEYCDSGPNGVADGYLDGYSYYRNSYHWNRAQFAAIPLADRVNLLDMPDQNYYNASIKHFLHGPEPYPNMTVTDTLGAEAGPQDASGYRPTTVYEYQGQTDPHIGTFKQIARVYTPYAQALEIQRNTLGRPTNTTYYNYNMLETMTSTYTNMYDASGRYLQKVWGPHGELVRGYGYHPVITNLLTSVTNAAADVLRYTHDTNTMKVTSITMPSGLVQSNIYFSSGTNQGFLQARIDYLATGSPLRTNSFAYTNGNLFAETNELGLVTTYAWDNLNRLISTTFPDGTISNVYDKLDMVASKDKLNQWTYFVYNNVRQLTAVTNANGQVIQYSYCGCGAPSQITRWNGSTPVYAFFSHDLGGRLTNAAYADGYSLGYAYDYRGLLSSITDGSGREWMLDYAQLGSRFERAVAYLGPAGPSQQQLFFNQFDEYGRITNSIDRNGVMTAQGYDYLNRLVSRQAWGYLGPAYETPQSGPESFVYDSRGLTNCTDPLGHLTSFVRDTAGRIQYQTNANQEVLQFTYNPAGELLTLKDGKNQVTTWHYDEYGRVTNKLDQAGAEIFRYQYDPVGRLTNRWSAAKANTAYKYDPIGNVTNVVYPVSSNIVFRYDTLNRLTNMVDGIGSSAFTWTPGDQLASEDGPWSRDAMSYTYDNRLRSGLSLQQPNASDWSQTYAYDAAARLSSVASPAGTFGYQYASVYSGTLGAYTIPDLIQELDLPGGSFSYRMYDHLARLTNTTLYTAGWSSVLDSHSYAYDLGSQRTQQVFKAGNYVNYTYDPVGQLKTAKGTEADGVTSRLHEQFGYAYDKAWNLNYRTNNALTQTFGVNNLNELTNASRSGSLTIAGAASGSPTSVTVSGTGLASGAANLYGDGSWARSGATLANGSNGYTASATDSYSRTSQDTVTVNLPATNTFSYDSNGNLLSDGQRYLVYDDENQLVSVTVSNAWRSEFAYDGMLRRRIRKEYAWAGGTWLKTNEVRYLYDGRLVLQERDANNLAHVTYTRGNDLSGTPQRAGGIGGLLARTDNGSLMTGDANAHAYYGFDGNGNVTTLVNTNSQIAAKYSYDPFGNILAKTGGLADANTYRFSSKEFDQNSGLIYYLYRYYEPNLQRWINTDPIAEAGGINLFAFADNSPEDFIDLFGNEFEEGSECARNADREGHEGGNDPDKHTKAKGHGGKKGKPNMQGKPPTAAERLAINEQKIREGKIIDPSAPMKNKGPKMKIRGSADPRLLGHVALVGAETACAISYKKCLDSAQGNLDNQLDAAAAINPSCGVDPKDAIDNAMDIFHYSAAECAAKYAICGLAALLPF